MKNRTVYLFLSFFILCYNFRLGAQNKETRKLANFSEIKVSGIFDVILIQDNKTQAVIEIEAEDSDLLKKIITDVKKNQLSVYISRKHNLWRFSKKIPKVYISFKELKYIYSSGSSSIHSQGKIHSEIIEAECSGSGGEFGLEIDVNRLSLKLSGSGNAKLSGKSV